MGHYWKYNASYSIWSQISPPIGKEELHCDRKRGYSRARKKEPEIKHLLSLDNNAQRVGILAQRAVYEFHQNVQLLSELNGFKRVAESLNLSQELPEIRQKIERIISNYHYQPILLSKNILELSRGDEPFPDPIPVKYGGRNFALYTAFDCVLMEPDETIHILDFKTGKSSFDVRQAYVYLLGAKYRYPNCKAVASFYNLESQLASEPISATSEAIESVCLELSMIAYKQQQDIEKYRNNPQLFDRIFPANPGFACQGCVFKTACEYAVN